MLNSFELEQCRKAEIISCAVNSLTDLKTVSIDTQKTGNERIISFVEQVKNPYLFKVGDTVVKVVYGNGKDITNALADLMR